MRGRMGDLEQDEKLVYFLQGRCLVSSIVNRASEEITKPTLQTVYAISGFGRLIRGVNVAQMDIR